VDVLPEFVTERFSVHWPFCGRDGIAEYEDPVEFVFPRLRNNFSWVGRDSVEPTID
jgi:hypothetical protein